MESAGNKNNNETNCYYFIILLFSFGVVQNIGSPTQKT